MVIGNANDIYVLSQRISYLIIMLIICTSNWFRVMQPIGVNRKEILKYFEMAGKYRSARKRRKLEIKREKPKQLIDNDLKMCVFVKLCR